MGPEIWQETSMYAKYAKYLKYANWVFVCIDIQFDKYAEYTIKNMHEICKYMPKYAEYAPENMHKYAQICNGKYSSNMQVYAEICSICII